MVLFHLLEILLTFEHPNFIIFYMNIKKKYFHENLFTLYSNDYLPLVNCCCYINTDDYPVFHSHEDYWEFTILESGTLENNLYDYSDIIRPGTLFFASPKDVHCLTKVSNKDLIKEINITIKSEVMDSLLKFFPKNIIESLYTKKKSFPLPGELLKDIEQSIYRYNLLTMEQYEAGNTILLSIVLRLLGFIINKHAENANSESVFLKNLFSLISTPDFLTYSVADLCKKLNYSRVQLNRIFKKELNTTPHNYLIDQKFIYAKNLLLQSDLTITSIAQKIGYANLAQFNITFKKKFSVTPGQYRKSKGKEL